MGRLVGFLFIFIRYFKKNYIFIIIFVKFIIIVDGIEFMEFVFLEEDLVILRYNVMICKIIILLMFELK